MYICICIVLVHACTSKTTCGKVASRHTWVDYSNVSPLTTTRCFTLSLSHTHIWPVSAPLYLSRLEASHNGMPYISKDTGMEAAGENLTSLSHSHPPYHVHMQLCILHKWCGGNTVATSTITQIPSLIHTFRWLLLLATCSGCWLGYCRCRTLSTLVSILSPFWWWPLLWLNARLRREGRRYIM